MNKVMCEVPGLELTEDRFQCFKHDYEIYGTHTSVDEYGTEQLKVDEEPKCTIHVMWVPVTDEIAVRAYGVDAERMLQCIYYGDENIQDHDRVKIRDNQYEIVSIKVWNTHRILRARQIVGE